MLRKNHFLDYNGALEDYNKSIEINPNCYQTYYNRAVI